MVNVSTNTKGNINISATPANNVTANSKNNQDVNANTNNDYLLSKSWAVGKGLIQGEDHSAKHYAQQAKASEKIASSAIQNIDDIANQAIEDIETTQNEALENLETAKDEKITEINNTASDFEDDLTTLTQRAETAATNAESYATSASSDASSAHLYAVDANESKTSAITSATTATNAKNDAQTAAISANSSAADAQNANVQAQTSATTASNAATSAANSANQAISAKDTAYDYAQQAQAAKTQIEQSLINYYTKSETYSKTEVQALIASIPQFSVEVVQSLPATGERMVLYLVPKDGETPDVCNEYIWVENENRYELIGNTAIDLTNYVTTDTAQDISGRKTFLGEKAIYFKQQATSNKLGFTLYNPSNTELAALEYRPNTISGASLLALNCPQTTGGYVGFRYWGTPAVNIVAPKVATAGNYFMATHITDGTNTVTASNTGTVNISTLLPDVSGFATQTWVQNQNYITSAALTDYVTNTSLATTLADYVTNSALTTTLADYALSADIPTKTSDLTNDSNFATVSQIPTNNNQLTNGAGYITNSALNGYATENFVTSQGYITGITSSDVTTALGYTPYNSSNPSGYQANKIETIKINGTAQTITSKAVDITVPTNNNQLTNGAGYITASALNGYAKTADLATVATSGSYDDLTDKPYIPSGVVVDQTYDATSQNAQSGVAISNAKFIQNTATGTNSLTILGTTSSHLNSINIGVDSTVYGQYATAIGYNAIGGEVYATAIGCNAGGGPYSTAIGCNAHGGGPYSTAIGYNALVESNNSAIQIGYGTNLKANTLSVGFYNSSSKHYNWLLLDGTTGLIPDARISTNIARTNQIPTVPTNISAFTNDSEYITNSALSGYAKTADLATVATSGSYNDLTDKPSIPSAVTESTVSGWGFTKNTGTVTSVNNVSPVNGNVTLSIPDIEAYTAAEVQTLWSSI